MSDQPAVFATPTGFEFNPDFVRGITRDLARGQSFADIAKLRNWSEVDLAQHFGLAVDVLLDTTFLPVTAAPEGTALVVSLDNADEAMLDDFHSWLDEVLLEGTNVIVGNVDVVFQHVTPPGEGQVLVATSDEIDEEATTGLQERLEEFFPGANLLVANFTPQFQVFSRTADDAVLVVTAEECDEDDLAALQAHLKDALPDQPMIVANFHFDAEEVPLEDLVATRNRMNETIKEMGRADEDGGYTYILSTFRDLAARYLDAMWKLGPADGRVRDPDARLDVELRDTGDAWRLRFMEGDDPAMGPVEAPTLVALVGLARSFVESTERFAAEVKPS